jgi:hypothetical protein
MLDLLDHVPPLAWLVLLLLAIAAWWLSATRVRRGNARRGAIARRAEVDAESLLRGLGYAVEDRQVTGTFDLSVDGRPVPVRCRADLLVRRRRRRFVAEVKTGTPADPTHPDTRRQLLEYRLVFPVDGVLLVDVARGAVMEVAFPRFDAAR